MYLLLSSDLPFYDKNNNNESIAYLRKKNIVPLFFISNFYKGTMQPGKLADIAPSILKVMNLEIPKAMDGTPLF